MTALLLAATCLAGSLGAVARFVVDGELRRRWPSSFPWATFWVNVSGSLLLGLVTGAVLGHGAPSAWRTVVGTGFCGGYTTFSTAVVEAVRLAQDGSRGRTAAYAGGTLAATTTAAAAGLLLGWRA